ncbi:synaptotagmin-like protein 2 isoform X2 [Cololabis saira]|uniref:synaptotagmin-like protein 2 isoform X2 n=1 Tax=Cololabis saira TaxID=129043 RepID=UPI002AD2758E|nr:synaptotagmin-like protein 2 isoform X2 [Cololabis saira]
MIDLSHLTEEEQGVIMAVLRRDADLKKAEEERVRKLEQIPPSDSPADVDMKYLTGEWFYEAKSLRHSDKIHGSEIILASMKQGRPAGSDGSLRFNRSKAFSSRSLEIKAPQKPARSFETPQPQPEPEPEAFCSLVVPKNDAEKENRYSAIHSPRMIRHNPFNRASLIVVEPTENNYDMSVGQDQEPQETEPISPLKNHPAGESSHISRGPITSEGSSAGFRPVPKKRTFLSRRTSSQSESNGQLGSDGPERPAGIVPAPRRRLQRTSTGSSNQSCLKDKDEAPQKSASEKIVQSAQPSRTADDISSQLLCDYPQISSISSLERERKTCSVETDRSASYTRTDMSTEREMPKRSEDGDDQNQRERGASNFISLQRTNIKDEENSSSVAAVVRQEAPSLPQSIVDPDPPVSYELNFIEKSDQQTQKSNPKDVFKLSTQATSPTGEEEESIAKVLDWFNRSSDSGDWLDEEKSSDRHAAVCKLRDEESLARDAAGFKGASERKKDTLEAKKQKSTNEVKELKATRRKGSRELVETQEDVEPNTRERMYPEDVKDNAGESQPLMISHLKSFWEKSNTGPKILISKSVEPDNKEPNSAVLSPEREVDTPSVSGKYNEKGTNDKYTSNQCDERKQPLVISSAANTAVKVCLNNHQKEENVTINANQRSNENSAHLKLLSSPQKSRRAAPEAEKEENVIINSNQRNNENSAHLKLLSSPQKSRRAAPEAETLCVTKVAPPERTSIHPEMESVYAVKPNLQLDIVSKLSEPLPEEPISKAVSLSKRETDFQQRLSSDSEELRSSSPFMDPNQGENDVQIGSNIPLQRGSREDVKRRDSEDMSMHSSMSPKRKDDAPNKDKSNSPRLNRQAAAQQECTAERIRQLKSFWEQERNKPVFYTGKPKALGEGKVTRGTNPAKLNKRFTKSEFDLRSIGDELGSDEEDDLPLNRRLDKLSPSLGASRKQFHTLREFWGEATAESRGLLTLDKPKSSKRKDQLSAQFSSQELKGSDAESYRLNPFVEKTKTAVAKSSSSPQNRSKSPHDRQTGGGSRMLSDCKNNLPNYIPVESGLHRQSRRSSKDSNREDKSSKPQTSSGKEVRAPKSRKDNFSISSSRGNSLRRATSMFALSVDDDEQDPSQLRRDASPVHSQSRKLRQNADKGAASRRMSEESETVAPRARAFVPRDYRHYLGMTDNTSIDISLAPAVSDQGSDFRSGYELELGGLGKASTPVSSEERYSRRGSKTSQRPVWTNFSGSDTGQESSVSSVSDTWSSSRTSSYRENDDEEKNPVRKALRRAEARPKNLAKSMEDITASVSPRQERRQDPIADSRRGSDVLAMTSPTASLLSDADHLKNMSKSVPSFLQKELSGSVMTMYSGDFVEVQGNIQFSINYVQRLREFHIFVAECHGLAAVDPKRGRSDPYVKSYLVPDKANLGKRKTSVKKKTLNPTFNEILRYRVRMEYLRTQTLILSVWHHDTFGRNSFLGEVDLDLSKWDFDHTQMNYLALKARTTPTVAPPDVRGEMKLAIRFLPQITHSEGITKDAPNTGEIHIWVKECKNLPLIRATIDPYVKCFVLPDTSRKSRQKTRVLRRTTDPVFNHTMVYDGISEVDLTDACIELTVWDRDRLASNLLGGLRLGAGTGRSYGALVDWMDSGPYEVALWKRMMASQNEWVEDVLPLRMLNSAKTAFK